MGHVERRVRTGRGAHVLFVPPDHKAIYVSNRVDGRVTILDPATLEPRRSFKIPGGPDDMVFAPDGRIWVSRRWAQAVAVIATRERPKPDDTRRSVAARHLAEPCGAVARLKFFSMSSGGRAAAAALP